MNRRMEHRIRASKSSNYTWWDIHFRERAFGGGADLKIQSSTPLGNVALMLYGATDETQICTDGLTAPNVSKRGEQTAILDCIRVSCRAKPVDWQY